MAACLGFLGFPVPLLNPKPSSQELYKKRSALLRRYSRQGENVTATKLLALHCSNRDIVFFHLTSDPPSLNQTKGRHLASVMNPVSELFYCMDVSSCAQKSLVGYWVGPDIDDGWGFVEAFINKIT